MIIEECGRRPTWGLIATLAADIAADQMRRRHGCAARDAALARIAELLDQAPVNTKGTTD